jgi:hypothetical protein
MYAERNSRLRLGPASDRIHRLSPATRTAGLRSHVQKGRSVVTGSDTKVCRLPTGLPSRCHDALIAAYEEGFPVISRLSAGITSGSGNPVTRQGISLLVFPEHVSGGQRLPWKRRPCMSPCRGDHLIIRVAGMSGVWSLRILATERVFPADCPHPSHFHCLKTRGE